jgi:hypothetical protein
MLAGTADLASLAENGRLQVEGDGTKLGELLGLSTSQTPTSQSSSPERTHLSP